MAEKKEKKETKEKKVYIFFNCDEAKSQQSMNVFYNNTVYGDTKKARKELLNKVEGELAEGKLQIEEAALEGVRDSIMNGNPTDASASIKFGAIEAFNII